MKRVAFLLKGAVAKKGIKQRFEHQNAVYATAGEYVNIQAVANSIKKHIIDVNTDCQFDFFIHCWNTDLETKLNDLYHPKLSAYENNNLYNDEIIRKCVHPSDYGGISFALSLSKCIDLKIQYEKIHNFTYDIVIVYRPDVLLWKDMILQNYDLNAITVNYDPPLNTDFHFIMNSKNADLFRGLYESADSGNKYKVHYWIRNYIQNYLHIPMLHDDIVPGRHQEVFKSLYTISINGRHISLGQLQHYGITQNDLF